MGQYFYIVNPAKRQYLHPHRFGAGLKFMEFSGQENSIMQALAVLLSDGMGRGGGDLEVDKVPKDLVHFVGSWAGDPVVVAGDYGEAGRHMSADLMAEAAEAIERPDYRNLHGLASERFTDISDDLIRIIAAAEGSYGHPLAAIDLSDEGWRHPPAWGETPASPPASPPDKAAWEAFAARAANAVDAALSQVETGLRRLESALSKGVPASGAGALEASKRVFREALSRADAVAALWGVRRSPRRRVAAG